MNSTTKWIIGIIIVVIVIVVGYSLKSPNEPVETGPIKIGVISGMSGEYAVIGEAFRNGIVLAHEIFTQNNPDTNITLIIENDEFDSKKGLSAYKKLTEINNIDALINLTSPTINSIYDLATKIDMPVIQGGEQGQDPTSDNIFQIMPGNIVAEAGLGKYLKDQGYDTISIVYVNDSTMVRFVDALKNGFGGETVEYKINPQEKDLRTIALKLSATNPSAVAMMMFPEQGALFLKEFLRISTSKPIFAFDIASNFQSGSEDYKKILGNLEVLDDSVALTVDDSITEEFKQSYKDRFEIEPGWGADLGFDAFNLLIKTFSVDGKKWINNIKTSKIEGIGGDIIFDENGVRSPSFTIKTIKNGLLE